MTHVYLVVVDDCGPYYVLGAYSSKEAAWALIEEQSAEHSLMGVMSLRVCDSHTDIVCYGGRDVIEWDFTDRLTPTPDRTASRP